MKHHDAGAAAIVEMDAEECALAAILRAVADYKTLTGTETSAMKALLAWCYINLESAAIMKQYENLPDVAKKL